VTGYRAADVVDHHPCAAGGKQQRVLLAELVAGTGDDGDLAVESEIGLEAHQLTGSASRVAR
jgi:hypothetical protein